MNENNPFSTALGTIGIFAFVVGAVLWLFGAYEQSQTPFLSDDPTAGLTQFALANQLFTLGSVATLLWLVVRAIIAQLVYKPREDRVQS